MIGYNAMDITLLSSDSIKIKGKQGSLVFNPTKSVKTTADAILFLTKDYSESQIPSDLKKEARVIIAGAGEYEVSGIKISGQCNENEVLYTLNIDGLVVSIGNANMYEKAHGKLKDCHVVVCNCDTPAHSQSLLSTSPRYAVLYGANKTDVAKSLGKENISPVNKFTTAIDKLPLEMEVVVLG